MKIRSLLGLVAVALSTMAATCSTPKPVGPPPIPTPIPSTNYCVAPNVHVGSVTGSPVPGATVTLSTTSLSGTTNADGYLYLYPVPSGLLTIHVAAPNFFPADVPYNALSLTCDVAIALQPTIPTPPTRDQALNFRHHFQGLTCHTDQYGDEPMFTASLAWHNAASRKQIYDCLKAAGDTFIDVMLPDGYPLYDEPGQFYSPDKFGPLDWTANDTRIDPQLAALVAEVRQAGLLPTLHMDERSRAKATWQVSAVCDALASSTFGDLRLQVAMYLPGYDGVFYGQDDWEPSGVALPAWGAAGRAHCGPNARLGLEFNTGHLPQEAQIDLSNYDALFIEFNDANIHDNNTFGILERLIGPAYVRPPDDVPPNDGGDGHPRPWIQHTTPRGERQTVCFEWATYEWVRGRTTTQAVEQQRKWLLSLGCPTIG